MPQLSQPPCALSTRPMPPDPRLLAWLVAYVQEQLPLSNTVTNHTLTFCKRVVGYPEAFVVCPWEPWCQDWRLWTRHNS